MERKEVVIYFYVGILVLAAIFAVYLFNLQLTGFAVFTQDNQTAFGEGTYNNVEYDVNDRVIILGANQTSGTYTSKVFDAGSSATWNNLTWTGNEITFQVKACSAADCSNANFSTATNLNNLNLTGQYFRYRASFDSANDTLESVSIDYSLPTPTPLPENVSVSISEPSDEYSNSSGIPIEFTFTGENVTCWYNVEGKVSNTTPVNCSDLAGSEFSVSGDGDYTFNLYINGSAGFAYDGSSFSVATPSQDETPPVENTTNTTLVPTPVPVIPVITPTLTNLSLQGIEKQTLNPSGSKELTLNAKNTGDVTLTLCKMSAGGDNTSLLNVFSDSQTIGAGETKGFAFSLAVPEDAEEGEYSFPLTVKCDQITKSIDFSASVIKKRVDFNITDVSRTSAGIVKVSYSMRELLNKSQSVSLKFLLLDSSEHTIANASIIQNLSAAQSKNFKTSIPINSSLDENTTLTLKADLNSEQYFSSVSKPITLGAPIGGFVIFGDNGLGTGGIALVAVVFVVLVATFFVVRRIRIGKRTGKEVGK